jgi:prepilin-type processing-associated H-X9-DG protein
MRGGNSLNHQQEGQNVLYADAHVEFQQNPFCGQKRDNIYTFNGSEVEGRNGESAIVGPPADANDSVMLPTAADVGFKAPPPPPPDQPFDAAAATKKLAGKYVAEEAFGPRPVGATLQITDNTITLTDTALRLSYEYRVSEESDPAAGEYVLELLVDGKPHVMIGVRTEDGGVSVEVEHETPSYAGVLMGRWRAAR